MITIAETPTFTRQCSKIFSDEEKSELIEYLAKNPLAGDEIPGTGGVRKIRFAASGRGKRGGARIVYYYLDDEFHYMLYWHTQKNARTDNTPEEKKQVTAFVELLKAARRRRQ